MDLCILNGEIYHGYCMAAMALILYYDGTVILYARCKQKFYTVFKYTSKCNKGFKFNLSNKKNLELCMFETN